jgi:Aspartyl protease
MNMRTSKQGRNGARSLQLAVVAWLGWGMIAGCAGPRGAQPVASEAPRASTLAAPVTITLQPLRTRLRTVTVKVGSETGTFLLDTASGISLVSPDFAKKVGCEPWGRLTGFQMFGRRLDTPQCSDLSFEAAGLTLRAPTVAVLDFSPFLEKGSTPLDGVLALDVFAGQALTLDLGNERLIVETPESLAARTQTMREGQARLSREMQGAALSVFTAVRTPKGLAWFELDSGNGGTLLMSQHIAPVLGVESKGEQPQPARFELVGGVPVEGNFHVPDMIIDGNLGMPFLSKWLVTLDLARSRVWFQPGGPGESASTAP